MTDMQDKVALVTGAIVNVGSVNSVSAELAPQGVRVLCSDEASYITGRTLAPDGGFTLTV